MLDPLPVVCLATGDLYGRADQYINRMYSMLRRHCPCPFTLHCFSDRPRRVDRAIQIRSCAEWKPAPHPQPHATTAKLNLFNAEFVPFAEFFYLDLTLVIRRDMSSFLERAFGAPEDLVVVNEWYYPCYNSCAMRIRRGALQSIYDDYASGTIYPQHNPGDQDFIHAHIAARGLQHRVALFAPEQVVSFKKARHLQRTDPAAARRMVENATIVKFHGTPKMHQVAHPFYQLFKSSRLLFFKRELYRNWR